MQTINPKQKIVSSLRSILEDAARRAMADGTLPQAELPAYSIETPKDPGHGDLSANLAMVGARAFRCAPRAVAEALTAHMNLEDSFFTRCEIAGPGFLNFFLSDEGIAPLTIQAILAAGKDYGRTQAEHPQKIMVEFVSANPTGPMHIGNARGGVIGDCLAACLDACGEQVTREFYINDAGNQVERFALSLLARYREVCGDETAQVPEDGYHGEDVLILARAFHDEHFAQYGSEVTPELKEALTAFGLARNIAAMQKHLGRFGVEYDVWFKESSLHAGVELSETMDLLKASGHTYESDGALWLRTTDFGCEKDDVLIRSNGFYTYFAVDIAYHRNKFLVRGFDRVINVWGADHHGHVARLKAALSSLGIDPERLHVVLMQMVRLMRDGEQVKVSKRSGKSITLIDLLDEMPLDSARFFFNLRSPDSHFDVDLDLAVSNTSQNPVYYVQYAHARICSVLSLMQSEGIDSSPEGADAALLKTPAEHALILLLADLPEVIREAAATYDPSQLTRYSIALATAFHKFYTECRVRDAEPELRRARIALLHATRQTLANTCALLGISAPEKM